MPCAQGRVIVESSKPAPPSFATCSTYRRVMLKHQLSMAIPVPPTSSGIDIVAPCTSAPATTSILQHPHKAAFATRSVTLGPQSPASRPEDLHVKPWYAINESIAGSSFFLKDSPDYPIGHSYDADIMTTASSTRALDAVSTRTSSIESEQQPQKIPGAILPRKACMDLNEAIALLDEMCPNPEVSPQTTPRTPLTPHSRNKRARSKSSDNSSNYSTERLNEKENHKEKKRPFLKKIGLSMTEDRPFLAKFAPRLLGKPYLEKIGPSRAVEKPFLEKIGSSRTLDKFTFDTPKNDKKKDMNASRSVIAEEELEDKSAQERRDEIRSFTTGERRKSGKNFLSKMYSFETEDLEDPSLTMKKAKPRGPLRGASLDDVLDSGPSSMPRISELSAVTSNSDMNRAPSTSVAELVKCRVTTSEEIISSGTSLNSPMDIISWGNSPRRRGLPPSGTTRNGGGLIKQNKSNESVPNSPTKRGHSITPEKVTAVYKEIHRMKPSRQASEDILDKRKSRFDKYDDPRGASSDNLTKERVVTPVFAEIGSTNINGKGSNSSVVSTSSSLKQFYDKYEGQEIFTETYAEFKRRTQGNFSSSNALKRLVAREKMSSPSFDLGFSSKDAALEKMKSEGSPKVRSKSVENNRQNNDKESDKLDFRSRKSRHRSTLRKQQGIDHSNYNPTELEEELSQRKKMIHEPSQETLDLLFELQKVKSSLKTPSVDKTYETDIAELKPFPKRILLTDQEFCLSIERENSVRRPSRKNTLEAKNQDSVVGKSPEKKSDGPALFEKRCLSLDYVDDEKSATKKPEEPRALSLVARSPRSEGTVESSDTALLSCDSKSYSSDVFNSPTEDAPEKSVLGISVEKEVKKIESEIQNLQQEKSDQPSKKVEVSKTEKSQTKKLLERNGKKKEKSNNLRLTEKKETKGSKEEVRSEQLSPKPNNSELEKAGNREVQQTSPKRKCQSDPAYEVTSSPKATPFRIKKRLGRVSVEETVKQESFTVNKVECKDVTNVQKRAKCLPL